MDVRGVVLVEGDSDKAAVEALAARLGRDLTGDGVIVVAMGGARSIRRFVDQYGPRGLDVRLAGLCDAPEEGDFRRGLARSGIGNEGFFVCDADLEDEMIRALGADRVEAAVGAEGDLHSFRIFQKQPAQQGRAVEQQLRRFMGTRSGRKIRYGTALVDALDLDQVPPPLAQLLAFV